VPKGKKKKGETISRAEKERKRVGQQSRKKRPLPAFNQASPFRRRLPCGSQEGPHVLPGRKHARPKRYIVQRGKRGLNHNNGGEISSSFLLDRAGGERQRDCKRKRGREVSRTTPWEAKEEAITSPLLPENGEFSTGDSSKKSERLPSCQKKKRRG